ncbi:hypothetical protein ADN00_07650 [Ornatilinea apprima]|uniref:Uncharacterized protein n=1 Tax=Ornatilinea apprima TaxID=1134406 RepID=A0A0P6XTA6_9CHLR|nr:hypothetical protein [Ornatilinea apprima]KPL78318.1 hypothetical protein ADN00_07650 [Ornatilinea apprima]
MPMLTFYSSSAAKGLRMALKIIVYQEALKNKSEMGLSMQMSRSFSPESMAVGAVRVWQAAGWAEGENLC